MGSQTDADEDDDDEDDDDEDEVTGTFATESGAKMMKMSPSRRRKVVRTPISASRETIELRCAKSNGPHGKPNTSCARKARSGALKNSWYI